MTSYSVALANLAHASIEAEMIAQNLADAQRNVDTAAAALLAIAGGSPVLAHLSAVADDASAKAAALTNVPKPPKVPV